MFLKETFVQQISKPPTETQPSEARILCTHQSKPPQEDRAEVRQTHGQQSANKAIGKSAHTGSEAGKQLPTEPFKDTLGQSGKLSIAVINWEAARAEGGSGALQSAIGWLGSHKNIMLIIQPEMKDHEWLGVARALNQAADNTRISVRGSRSQAIFSESFFREEEITSVFC